MWKIILVLLVLVVIVAALVSSCEFRTLYECVQFGVEFEVCREFVKVACR